MRNNSFRKVQKLWNIFFNDKNFFSLLFSYWSSLCTSFTICNVIFFPDSEIFIPHFVFSLSEWEREQVTSHGKWVSRNQESYTLYSLLLPVSLSHSILLKLICKARNGIEKLETERERESNVILKIQVWRDFRLIASDFETKKIGKERNLAEKSTHSPLVPSFTSFFLSLLSQNFQISVLK